MPQFNLQACTRLIERFVQIKRLVSTINQELSENTLSITEMCILDVINPKSRDQIEICMNKNVTLSFDSIIELLETEFRVYLAQKYSTFVLQETVSFDEIYLFAPVVVQLWVCVSVVCVRVCGVFACRVCVLLCFVYHVDIVVSGAQVKREIVLVGSSNAYEFVSGLVYLFDRTSAMFGKDHR